MKLLLVCLGNICRSPLAEGILKEKLKKAGLNFFVDSAGMIHFHVGECPDYRSIQVARKNGIDISNQKARQFSIDDFENFELIFAMDQSVYDEIISLAKTEHSKSKVHLFLDFAGYKESFEVPDPYYGANSEFDKVFQLLDEASEKIVEKILRKVK